MGSGVDTTNARELLAKAPMPHRGTSLKYEGVVANRIDAERVKRLAQLIRAMA